MAKQITYTIEVVQNGETLYYRRNNLVVSYVTLEMASSTADLAELGRWEDYAKNDLSQGSIASFDIVELELKVKNANVDADVQAATAAEALAKLTQVEKDALGL